MLLDSKAEVDTATAVAQYIYFSLVDLTVDRPVMLMLSSAKPLDKQEKPKATRGTRASGGTRASRKEDNDFYKPRKGKKKPRK